MGLSFRIYLQAYNELKKYNGTVYGCFQDNHDQN